MTGLRTLDLRDGVDDLSAIGHLPLLNDLDLCRPIDEGALRRSPA